MSSNLPADNVPTPIQEPVAVTVNPVKTPLTVQATPAKVLPPSSVLTPPPTVEAPSQRKRKRPRILFVNYLEEDDRPSRRSRRLWKSHPYKNSQEEDD